MPKSAPKQIHKRSSKLPAKFKWMLVSLSLCLSACQNLSKPFDHHTRQIDENQNPVKDSVITNRNNDHQLLPKKHWSPSDQWRNKAPTNSTGTTGPASKNFSEAMVSFWQNPHIEELTAQAITTNPDLQILSLRIQAGQKQLGAIAAASYPNLDINLNRSRNNSFGFPTHAYQTSLDVSWLVDWWGQVADQKRSASLVLAANRAELAALKQLLAAELSRHWIRNWQLQEKQFTLNLYLRELKLTQTILDESFRTGLGNIEDTVSIQTQLATGKARFSNLNQSRLALGAEVAMILGDVQAPEIFPSEFSQSLKIAKPNIPTPPLTLPAEALATRPDIQQAYLQLQAEHFDTSAKFKALLPSLVLSANVGKTSSHSGDLLKSNSVWNFVSALSHPLIRGGLFGGNSLRQTAEAQKLITQAQWWHYKKQVIKAIVEVETSLGNEQQLLQQIHQLHIAQQKSQMNVENWREKYRQGLASILELLQVQIQHREIQEQLIDAEAALMDNRVILALALGIGAQS